MLFVNLQVAGRVKGHVVYFSAITPDAQRDLLAHGPAGHEYRGLFPQQGGDFSVILANGSVGSPEVPAPVTSSGAAQVRRNRLLKY